MANLEGIVVGEFGKLLTLNCQDSNGVTQDVDSYTTSDMLVTVQSPAGETSYTFEPSSCSATYQLSFQFTSDSFPRHAGLWTAQLKIEGAGLLIKSKPFTILVEEGL